jgi:hypothetical protein
VIEKILQDPASTNDCLSYSVLLKKIVIWFFVALIIDMSAVCGLSWCIKFCEILFSDASSSIPRLITRSAFNPISFHLFSRNSPQVGHSNLSVVPVRVINRASTS